MQKNAIISCIITSEKKLRIKTNFLSEVEREINKLIISLKCDSEEELANNYVY